MSGAKKTLLGGALGLVVILGGLAWWLGFFEQAAEEVTTEAAVEAAAEVQGDAVADGVLTDLTGSWTIVADGASFVGYRIDEVLTTVGDFTVVGRTDGVTGAVEADGTTITATNLVADMTTITTDNSGRDAAMRGQALETSEFPEATFVLTSPIELGTLPGDGESVDVVANGDLTIHGVTQSVEFPLTATVTGQTFVVIGQLGIALADYDISTPSAPIVASVEDEGILELQLIFQRS